MRTDSIDIAHYPNRQRHRRIPLAARVTRYDDGPAYWSSLNMSASGLFITGSPILPPGTEVELGVWLPAEDDSVEVIGKARVVWANDPDQEDSHPQLPVGMGMELVAMTPADRDLLGQHLYGSGEPEATGELSASDIVEVGYEVGPYRVLDLIAAGGMGEVYVAEHQQLGRRVALKRLKKHLAGDAHARERFCHEGRLANRVHHPNILQITDFLADGEDLFYVMELVEGDNLADLLDRHGALPLARVLRIGIQLCEALDAVHQAGIIHRDLKAANVLVVRRGQRDLVKLLDFGVAKATDPDLSSPNETLPGIAVGTPAYMSPEQCLGEKPDQRSDLYALGVLFYQMITGRHLFQATSWNRLLLMHVTERPVPPSRVAPAPVPKPLEELILNCLAKVAGDRPQTAAEIGARLIAISETLHTIDDLEPEPAQPVVALYLSPPSVAERLADTAHAALGVAKRHAASLLALLVLILAAGLSVVLSIGAPRRVAVADHALPPVAASTDPAPATLLPAFEIPPPAPPSTTTADEPAPKTPSPTSKRRRTDPVQTPRLLERAKERIRGGDLQAGIKLCYLSLRQDPNNAHAYRTLGIAYSMANQTPQACTAYRRYLQLAPHAPDAPQVTAIISRCP